MKEISYEELTKLSAEARDGLCPAGLLDTLAATGRLDWKRYVLDDDGIVFAYRAHAMADREKVLKWAEEIISIETTAPVPGLEGETWEGMVGDDGKVVGASAKKRGKVVSAAVPGAGKKVLALAATQPSAAAPADVQIFKVPRGSIRPSPLNPRKHFEAEPLNELGANIRNNGLINPLVVRPWEGPLDKEYPGAVFELAAGERRWRSGEARPHPVTGELMPEIEEMTILLRDLTDAQMLETMLSENMKRNDLSEIEQSDAFIRALEQKTPEGEALYTVAQFAEKIGVSEAYVRQRLALKKLPKEGRAALASQEISFAVARTLCTCPSAIIPLVLDEVLHPQKYDRWSDEVTLDAASTHELIRQKYVRELRGAPFELSNPDLVPIHTAPGGERMEGGACTDCPWNTATQKEEEGEKPAAGRHGKGTRGGGRREGEGKFCLNPACFQKKVDIHVASALVKAKEEGLTILGDESAKKALHTYNSPYVKLAEKPGYGDLASDADEKKVPTWDKIACAGKTKPPVVIAVDEKGHVHRLVERKLAVAAARENGTDKFLSASGGRGRSSQGEDYDAQQKREREKAKERAQCSRAVVTELVAAIEEQGVNGEVWPALAGLCAQHAGHSGLGYVLKRRGIEQKPDVYQAAEKALAAAKGSALPALCLELLIAESMSFADSPHSTELIPVKVKPLLKLYGVDAKAITTKAMAEIAAAKKVKKEKAKPVEDGRKKAQTAQKKGGAK